MNNGIFLRPDSKAYYTNKNGKVNLNLSESVNINTNERGQRGGKMNDNLIHLEFSEDASVSLKGGNKNIEDSTEYFERIANKITSKLVGGCLPAQDKAIKVPAKGGFMGVSGVKNSDDFLTSESINNINLVGGSHKPETFNFSSFKRHLARASSNYSNNDDSSLSASSDKRQLARALVSDDDDDDEDDDDKLFDSTDDDDDDDDDEIIQAMTKSATRENNKHSLPVHSLNRAKRNNNTVREFKNPSESSDSLNLSDDNNYEISASAESPKLMAYRKVGQGRRFI